MLNLFKLNLSKNNIKSSNKERKKSSKYFPSSTRIWNNSIYSFDKNKLSLIPVAYDYSMKLVKAYINLYNNYLEQKIIRKRLLLNIKRLSSNKLFISNGEFKHTNNKVVITLYLFNRQKFNILFNIKDKFYMVFKYLTNEMDRNFFLLREKGNKSLIKMDRNNNIININILFIQKYITKLYKKFIYKRIHILLTYLLYKQLLFINKSKTSYTYLQYLSRYLEKIFNKNIEFNYINVKRFYLNSDIFSESILLKLKKNRKKITKYLNNLKAKVKTKKKNWLTDNIIKNEFNINQLLIKNKKFNILNDLKYKHVIGFKLKVRGRILGRLTASRSMYRYIYKGNLMNIDSSFRGLHPPILKGNLSSNMQHTKQISKTRIGSYGMKGWISAD